MRKFNLEEALNGHPICTRGGDLAKIKSISLRKRCEFKLRGIRERTDLPLTWTLKGKYNLGDTDSINDLFMVE